MKIGEFNELEIMRDSVYGLYLSDGTDEVLLPNKECSQGMRIGQKLRVFVLTDSEDRLIATTRQPIATVGEFALLRVVGVTRKGAFLDWGLDKDLFCPPKEQIEPMVEGRSYVVRVYLDEVSGRPACSTRLNRFLSQEGWGLRAGQRIKFMVAACNPEFLSVIIDGKHRGSLFKDEWVENLRLGDVREGFIKAIRKEDGRIAVSLRAQGYDAVMSERERLLDALIKAGGALNLSDRSSPDEIQRVVGMSKGAFKKLIGGLWKEGVIELEKDRIRLR